MERRPNIPARSYFAEVISAREVDNDAVGYFHQDWNSIDITLCMQRHELAFRNDLCGLAGRLRNYRSSIETVTRSVWGIGVTSRLPPSPRSDSEKTLEPSHLERTFYLYQIEETVLYFKIRVLMGLCRVIL